MLNENLKRVLRKVLEKKSVFMWRDKAETPVYVEKSFLQV